MIRVDAAWLATAPLDMRAGTDTALARGIATFGAAHLHHRSAPPQVGKALWQGIDLFSNRLLDAVAHTSFRYRSAACSGGHSIQARLNLVYLERQDHKTSFAKLACRCLQYVDTHLSAREGGRDNENDSCVCSYCPALLREHPKPDKSRAMDRCPPRLPLCDEPRKYILRHAESLNCTSLVDLLILEGCDAVVLALRELAATAQRELHDHPENVELESYASSMTWHYFCLWNGKKLRRLIRKAADKKAQAIKLKQDIAGFKSGFDAAMSELKALQKYVKLLGVHPHSFLPPLPTTAEPVLVGLAPATIARLSESFRSDLFLDGVAAELREAPWTGHALGSEYHADPLQRLEFLEACQKLLPTIVALRRSATKNERLEKTAATAVTLAVAARDEVQKEWDIVREGKPYPPVLGRLAREAIDQRRAMVGRNTASQVDTSYARSSHP